MSMKISLIRVQMTGRDEAVAATIASCVTSAHASGSGVLFRLFALLSAADAEAALASQPALHMDQWDMHSRHLLS